MQLWQRPHVQHRQQGVEQYQQQDHGEDKLRDDRKRRRQRDQRYHIPQNTKHQQDDEQGDEEFDHSGLLFGWLSIAVLLQPLSHPSLDIVTINQDRDWLAFGW